MKSITTASTYATSCRIYLDGSHWDCSGFRTRRENLAGAWTKLKIDYGNEYLPQSKDEFANRGGKVTWFKCY